LDPDPELLVEPDRDVVLEPDLEVVWEPALESAMSHPLGHVGGSRSAHGQALHQRLLQLGALLAAEVAVLVLQLHGEQLTADAVFVVELAVGLIHDLLDDPARDY
jgi:hypothetical protein